MHKQQFQLWKWYVMTHYKAVFTRNTNADKLNIIILRCLSSYQQEEVQCAFSLAVGSSNYYIYEALY